MSTTPQGLTEQQRKWFASVRALGRVSGHSRFTSSTH